MRGLSDTFIDNLKSGDLSNLLNYIKKDSTLDLEIRENYINVYYRGGNIIRIEESKRKQYKFSFEKKYFSSIGTLTINIIPDLNVNTDWNEYFPIVKQGMDFYFSKKKSEEREFQQLVVRENNYSSIANSTDYFIIDIEYDNHKGARFDLVAIEWESDSTKRKLQKGYQPKIAIIEMKFGDGALKAKSGMIDHIKGFTSFMSNSTDVTSFRNEMTKVFMQKLELGLMPSLLGENPAKRIKEIGEKMEFQDGIDFIFLLANHDPASMKLVDEISGMNNTIKFASANFFGYGLYKENILPTGDYKKRFNSQI